MLTCKQATEMATDRAEGDLGFLDRSRFDRHIEECDGCRAYARQLRISARAVALLPEPDISPALNEALMVQFDSLAAGRPRARAPGRARPSPWPILATVAMLGLLLAFGKNRSETPRDWALGAVIAVMALAVASLAGRVAVGIIVAAVAAAVLAAFLGGNVGGVSYDHGVVCFTMELVSAGVVGGAAWLGARGAPGAEVRRSLAAGAVAGALVADAALQVTCGAHESMPHLLAFHVAGVALVAGAALVVLRGREAPAA